MAKSYLELLGTNGALRGWHNGLGIIVAKQPFVLVRWVFLHSEMMRRVGLGVPGDGRSACFGSVTSKVRERLAEAEAQLRAKDRFCSCSTCRRLRFIFLYRAGTSSKENLQRASPPKCRCDFD